MGDTSTMGPKCPGGPGCRICGDDLPAVPIVECGPCGATYHATCLDLEGGCVTPRCREASRRSPIRAPSMALVLAGVSLVLLAFAVDPHIRKWIQAFTGGPVRGEHGPDVGQVAPDFALRDLSGRVVRLHTHRAGRPALLAFWKVDCPDCMPFVPGFARTFRSIDEGPALAVIHVSAFAQDAEQSSIFAREYGFRGTVVLDPGARAVSDYGLGTITAFILDRQGRIRYRGSQGAASADLLLGALKPLLHSMILDKTGASR